MQCSHNEKKRFKNREKFGLHLQKDATLSPPTTVLLSTCVDIKGIKLKVVSIIYTKKIASPTILLTLANSGKAALVIEIVQAA